MEKMSQHRNYMDTFDDHQSDISQSDNDMVDDIATLRAQSGLMSKRNHSELQYGDDRQDTDRSQVHNALNYSDVDSQDDGYDWESTRK